MKKILLTMLVSGGLMATTVVAAEQGKCNPEFDQCKAGKQMHPGMQDRDKHPGMRRGMQGKEMRRDMPMKMYRGLDLSAEQKDKIKAIFKKQDKAARSDMAKKQRQLADRKRQLIEAKTFDKAAFESLLAEQNKMRNSRSLKQAERRHQAWNVLTAEQQAKARERFNDRRELMEKERQYKRKWLKND